ncbi:MAG: TetR/AcrR family transcriptional regulator [Chloroflexi bacterium]|nr:MAG: TetR/AcrR family transcriptional regulator [Chloroflexota bacterium]
MRVHSVSEQERIDRRRAQILAAASRVFARQGFHRTTVREIAREAGLADGTIYLYFASKRELLLALLGQLGRVDERPADFAAMAGVDARTFIDAYLRRRFADLGEWRQLFAAVIPEVLADAGLRAAQIAQATPAFEAAEAELARRMEAGELPRRDPALATRVVASTIIGLLVFDVMGDPVVRARWEDLPAFLAGLWFDGLGSEGR